MPAGEVRVGTPNGVLEIPVYDPSTLATPAVRTAGPNGGVYAFKLITNYDLKPKHAVRIGGPNGTVYAIDASTATLLEGFEDGAWPDDWSGETHGYQLTTTAITGGYSLVTDGDDGFPQVMNANIATPRDQTYSCRMHLASGSAPKGWLLTNVQSGGTVLDNVYAAELDPANNTLTVIKRQNGTASTLASASVTTSYDTTYRVALDVASDQLQARVFDTSGTELGATGWVTDTTFTGGYIGVYTGGVGAGGSRYDDFTEHPLGAV